MVGNWRSRQELRYRNWLQTEVRRPLDTTDTFDGKKPFENWIVHFLTVQTLLRLQYKENLGLQLEGTASK
ncbi:Homoserine O-acetyltransferase [Trichinella pseudospiralis]|uniref:Uncharacterized protein n=1 Tax=Trichinella pseudospiralis TaxID=6337 RepID=A0A0V0Y164_TRIPS|nr:hypothetical protein T4E_4491 [Trichinella pseudospiralis]